ncbi:Regulator of chromosome condensation (RCC1) repeat protein [compost metagenome]
MKLKIWGRLGIVMAVISTALWFTGGDVRAESAVRPVSAGGGQGHGLAAWSDGSVTGWGYNKNGQVGDGTSIDQYIPRKVSGPSVVSQVSAWNNLSFALTRQGEVWAWGETYSPYIAGDAALPYQKRGLPVKLDGLKDVAYIAPSAGSIAVHTDGTATLWYKTFPGNQGEMVVKYAKLQDVKNAKTAAAVGNYALFLDKAGKVSSVRTYNDVYGRYVQEGDPSTLQPVASSVTRMTSNYNDAFLLQADGKVLSWNSNERKTKAVPGLSGVYDLASGFNRLFILKKNGTVWEWDYNAGSLAKPFQIQGLDGITAVWGSTGMTGYALRKDGTLLSWGQGTYAGMASGSGGPVSDKAIVPVQVQQPLSWKVNGKDVSFYASAVILKDKLYVPYTSVFKPLGVKVTSGYSDPDPAHYGNEFHIWNLAYGGQTLAVNMTRPQVVFMNGKPISSQLNIEYLADATQFPLEEITGLLGIPYSWDRTTGEVTLGAE